MSANPNQEAVIFSDGSSDEEEGTTLPADICAANEIINLKKIIAEERKKKTQQAAAHKHALKKLKEKHIEDKDAMLLRLQETGRTLEASEFTLSLNKQEIKQLKELSKLKDDATKDEISRLKREHRSEF